MTGMRPWLRWLLVLTVLTSAVALFWPENVTQAVSRTGATLAESAAAPSIKSPGPLSATPTTPLPAQLSAISLDKATFDPFVGPQPPPPPPAAAPPIAEAPAAPPPTAPPFDYRYVGRMVDPSGKQFVYLGKSAADTGPPLAVAVGTQLDSGYVVESINEASIHVAYPPLDTHVVIEIPPASESSAQ